jgi:hypothetical protein
MKTAMKKTALLTCSLLALSLSSLSAGDHKRAPRAMLIALPGQEHDNVAKLFKTPFNELPHDLAILRLQLETQWWEDNFEATLPDDPSLQAEWKGYLRDKETREAQTEIEKELLQIENKLNH